MCASNVKLYRLCEAYKQTTFDALSGYICRRQSAMPGFGRRSFASDSSQSPAKAHVSSVDLYICQFLCISNQLICMNKYTLAAGLSRRKYFAPFAKIIGQLIAILKCFNGFVDDAGEFNRIH